jgi:hypothetical protein
VPAKSVHEAGSFKEQAVKVSRSEREIQREIDSKEKSDGGKPNEQAMQAGTRNYPVPPLPAQHLSKPGDEADLDLQPMYDNPHYLGSNLADRSPYSSHAKAQMSRLSI